MLQYANIPKEESYKLFPEAVKTATLLDGLMIININGSKKTRYEHWGGSLPKFVNHLRTWGEAGTVTTAHNFKGKVIPRGTHCIFIGYAIDHPGDCYCMCNPTNWQVYETRDVMFLKRMYYKSTKTFNEVEVEAMIEHYDKKVNEDNDDDDQNEKGNDVDEGDDNHNNNKWTTVNRSTTTTTKSGRASVMPHHLRDYELNNIAINTSNRYDVLNDDNDDDDVDDDVTTEYMLVGSGIGGGFSHTEELKPLKY
jgi:hypothetical protein